MKKQLIAIGLVSFLAVPSVVFAEGDACAPIMSEGMTEEAVMAAKSAAMDTSECMGQRLGSIEDFSHGHGVSLYGSFRTGLVINDDTVVGDLSSRWGFQGSAEVSEGLTAAFRYEAKMNTATAESFDDHQSNRGRLSYVDLSGGFGAIRLGQIWSASANHYYFKIDPSHYSGKGGGSNFRNSNSISYSTSAGDVSFQIDKVTGKNEKVEFGATAALGPIGVGLGYWSNANDDASFTGVALSSGAAGVNLTIGLGSVDDVDGEATDISIINVGGSVGDSGITYGVQIVNSDDDTGDQNLIALTRSLGSGASLIFEIADPGGEKESTSIIGLRVDF